MKIGKKEIKITFDLVLKCIALLVLIVYAFLMIFGSVMFDPMSMFWRSLNIFSKAGEFNIVVRIISYIIFFLGASWLLRFGLKNLSKPLKKGKAFIDIFCSLIRCIAIIVLVFFVLKSCGVDTTAILAGIGILGLIVGLGAQPLIADILAGLFIVFEKLFDIGDIIVVDGFRGTILEFHKHPCFIMVLYFSVAVRWSYFPVKTQAVKINYLTRSFSVLYCASVFFVINHAEHPTQKAKTLKGIYLHYCLYIKPLAPATARPSFRPACKT